MKRLKAILVYQMVIIDPSNTNRSLHKSKIGISIYHPPRKQFYSHYMYVLYSECKQIAIFYHLVPYIVMNAQYQQVFITCINHLLTHCMRLLTHDIA